MEGRIWGYCRVSTAMQCEDRQLIALREYGVEEKRIFQDKKSGKNFDRPGYQRMLRALRRGDTVVFPSVDRMGRDYRLILEQWSRLMDRGVKIVVLDMPILNTEQESEQGLPGVLIGEMTLRLLCFLAESERKFICARVRAGIDAARERGVTLGRPKKERTPEFYKLASEYREGRITARAAARKLGISHPSFLSWAAEIDDETDKNAAL